MTEEKAVTTMTEEGVPVLTLEPLEQTALAEPAPAEVEPMLTEDTLTPEEPENGGGFRRHHRCVQ